MSRKIQLPSTNLNTVKRTHRRKRLFAATALTLGLVVGCLVAELALRAYVTSRGWTPNCYATGQAFFVPHPTAGYTLRPNLRLKSTTYDVTVNSQGFRGPGLDGTAGQRLVVLGGSSVFGYFVPDGEDSCRRLEELLGNEANEVSNASPIEVVNAGVPGYNITQCCNRYAQDIAPLQPKWVLLYLGWNDSPSLILLDPEKVDRTPSAPSIIQRFLCHSTLYGFVRFRLFPPNNPVFAPPADAARKVTPQSAQYFRSELQRLIDTIRSSGAIPVLSTQLMAAQSNCHGLERFLGETAQQIQTNRELGQWITSEIRRAAVDNDLLLIDCASKLPCDESLLGDAIHLTSEGHQAVAEGWAKELKDICFTAPQTQPDEQGMAP